MPLPILGALAGVLATKVLPPLLKVGGRFAGRGASVLGKLFKGKSINRIAAPTSKSLVVAGKGLPLNTIANVALVGGLAAPLAWKVGAAAGRLARGARTPLGMGLIGGGLVAGGAVAGGMLAGRDGGEMGAPGGFAGGLFDVTPPKSLAPGVSVAYSWNTGTATFHRLTDGRIAVQKKNGVWKVWRPAKHIVVSKNPRTGTLIRADKRIDKLMRGIARRLPPARRPTARRKVCA